VQLYVLTPTEVVLLILLVKLFNLALKTVNRTCATRPLTVLTQPMILAQPLCAQWAPVELLRVIVSLPSTVMTRIHVPLTRAPMALLHVNCITTDLCTPNVCNVSVGCQLTPIVCNDRNLCTQDICINGTCNYNTPEVCPSPNYCTPSTCAAGSGCSTTARVCLLNETCYSQQSDGTLKQFTPCASVRCNTDQACIESLYNGSAAGSNCDVFVCSNTTCLYTVSACPATLSTTAIIAGGIAAGVLAGIIIACVLCAALCGGGVFAVVNAAKHENQSEVYNNPLFKGLGQTFDNPINRNSLNN